MCATRGDSAPGPQGGEWGSPGEGLELYARRPHGIEHEITVHSRHGLAGHEPGRGLGESVTFGGNRMGTPARCRILGSHAAGGQRRADWRPPGWGGGESRAA